MDISDSTFFVTGATGRLGIETVNRLENLGAKVFPIVLKSGNKKPKRIKWVANSSPLLVNENNLNLLPAPDYVLNFHWKTNRKLSFAKQLKFDLHHSLFNSIYFWEWLVNKKIKKFINVSSIKIFSYLNEDPINSLSSSKPLTPYGIAKEFSELFFNQLYNSSFEVVNIRLSSVASVGEHPSHLVSQIFHSLFENKAIKINTGHKSNLLYIEEAVDLIIAAALYGSESKYNFGGEDYLNEEIVEKFEKISNKKINAEFKNYYPEIRNSRFIFDNNKFDQKFIRKFTLEKLLKKYISVFTNTSLNKKSSVTSK